MREAEGTLFGHAWLENDRDEHGGKVAARKSLVRIRLGQWSEGKLNKSQWTALPGVKHREVKVLAAADVYLGYGPVTTSGLKANAAIQAGEEASFDIAYPDEHAPLIEQALALMDRFGTVGGRSRNGWGSYSLKTIDTGSTLPLRDWLQCLQLDWPHAIGQDGQGALIWQTQAHSDWKALMKELAVLKIKLRTQFVFSTGKDAPRTEGRHWLSYPVTNHSVKNWGSNARLPNSLRLKVRPTEDGKWAGVIFHMPCRPPPAFGPDGQAIEAVWQTVHQFLDAPERKLTRSKD
jgi:CRISPR-associated protein Cmr1